MEKRAETNPALRALSAGPRAGSGPCPTYLTDLLTSPSLLMKNERHPEPLEGLFGFRHVALRQHLKPA